MNADPATFALAKAMATMDGVLDAFLAEASGTVLSGQPAYTGHFDGYMFEAASIIEDLRVEGFRLVQL
jgi:hypothetical protein